MNNIDVEEKLNALRVRLKEKGYKLTPQRTAVLEKVISKRNEHLTTEEIYDLVKQDNPEIGIATVYRTMQLLEELGFIYRLDFINEGCSRFDLILDGDLHQHHHLICTKCRKIIEVQEDLLDTLEKKIEVCYKFQIQDHSVKFYGLCEQCSEGEKEN